MTNGFLEKTIENWLTSASETDYQLAYSQVLIAKGYKIMHTASTTGHTPFEQGKDIIALDEHGYPTAFQLKGGNISLPRWRSEVEPEIRELMELPIKFPGIDKTVPHRSVLVTNGNLTDPVRLAINDRNERIERNKESFQPLEVVTIGALLTDFIAHSHALLSMELTGYKAFLDLYFVDGKNPPNRKLLSTFLDSLLPLSISKINKKVLLNLLNKVVLTASFLSSSYQKEENHAAAIEVLVILLAKVLMIFERFSVSASNYEDVIDIIEHQIANHSEKLTQEVIANGFELSRPTIWYGELLPFMKSYSIGHLLAYRLYQKLAGDPNWKNAEVYEKLFKQDDSFLFTWGEASFLLHIFLYWYLRETDDEVRVPEDYLSTGIDKLLKANSPRSDGGILSPYYSIEDAIKMKLGLLEEPIDEQFAGSSFFVSSFVGLISKNDFREILEPRWRKITHITQQRFDPAELWQNYLWRSPKGELKGRFSNQTQSWKASVAENKKIDTSNLPVTLVENIRFMPFFLLVFPHRTRPEWINFLDEKVSG